MAKVKIYHNPRCSKSRATLELLRERGVEPEIVEYLQTPPSAQELDSLLRMLSLEPRDLARKNEPAYKQASIDDPQLSRLEVIDRMVANPVVIERPVVVSGGRAAIGRPPGNVLAIL